MRKRLTALVIVLAMLLCVLPTGTFAAEASGTQTNPATDHAADDHSNTEVWTAWTDSTSLPTAAGSYYLDTDVQLTKGAWAIQQDIRLCLNGHTVTQKKANTRVIGILSGTLTICDCTAHEDENGNYIAGAITGGSGADKGAGIWVNRGCTLKLYGGRITDDHSASTAENTGSAVYLTAGTADVAGGAFYMYGGQICSNGAGNTLGGAVHVAGGATTVKPTTFTMTGGTLCHNNAKSGGAVYVTGHADVSISDAVITGNTAKVASAINILGVGATVTVTDSSITGNSNTYGFGAVNLANGASTLKIAGASVVYGNTDSAGNQQNLHLQKGDTFVADLSELTEGAKVGISLQASRISAGQMHITPVLNGADPSACCLSDSTDYSVALKEDRLYLTTHTHCLYDDTDCDHESLNWVAWSDPTTLPASGNYYLTTDVTLTKAWGISGEMNLCLNGHSITQTGSNARVAGVLNTGALSICDCTAYYDEDGNYIAGAISGGNTATAPCIWVARGGGTFNLYSGRITGNGFSGEGTSTAGAVYLQSGQPDKAGGVFNMYGGEISGNNATLGGAVYLHGESGANAGQTPAQFNMYGGTISGNTATGTGGAVYVAANASANLYGGAITGNEGGGVTVASANAKVLVEGDITVTGNTVYGKAGNLYLIGDALVTVGALGENARIGITADTTPRVIGSNETEDCTAYFVSDSVYRVLQMQEDRLYLGITTEHQHCLCGGSGSTGCDHSSVTWTAWESTTRLPNKPGSYYLLADVNLEGLWEVSCDVQLCLNGHTIRQTAEGARVLSVLKAGSLTLTDCANAYDESGNYIGGTVTGGNNAIGAGINVHRAGGEMNLYGGRITGNEYAEGTGSGGAVYLQSSQTGKAGGVFNMYGGEIVGNTAALGGAVYLHGETTQKQGDTPARFNMYGGTISGNTAKNGGGVYAAGDAAVTISGGVIQNNTADAEKAYGGGVFLTGTNTTMTMTGGEITENSAVTGGGGVYLQGGTAALSGGTIQKNTASSGAGILVNASGTLNMEGGSICNNKAVGVGGGVYFFIGNGDLSGGTVSGNHADKNGGGMWIAGSEVTLSGTVIKGNTVSSSGGGIGLGRAASTSNGETTEYRSTVTMTGGAISGNTARAGGGIYPQLGSTFILKSGSVSGNIATASGGGVFSDSNTTFRMEGGSVSGNQASNIGGGLYLLKNTGCFSGGSISGNRAGSNGGGMWLAGCQVTLSGAAIENNTVGEKGTAGGLGIGTAGDIVSNVKMTAGKISGNTARAGGGILMQDGTQFQLSGGEISYNKVTASGGGLFIGNDATITMTGGKISCNECTNHGAGIYQMNDTGNYSGGEISGNIASGSAGGLMIVGAKTTVTLNGTTVCENTARNGGGMVIQSGATVNVDGSEFCRNHAEYYGGAAYLSTKSFLNITSGLFRENSALAGGGGIFAALTSNGTMTGGTVTGNTSGADGGGILARGNFSIYNAEIFGNTASANGGGLATGKTGAAGWGIQPGLVMENTNIHDNTAGGKGGGVYLSIGSTGTLRSTTITGNKAAAEGGGLWAVDDLTMESLTVTGNEGTQGGGVYLAASSFDGHSYFTGVMKMSGDMNISGNTEGDLYLGEQTALVVSGMLGEGATVGITLDSGLLTDRVYGSYNYDGGNCRYTITCGDRSVTDPEYSTPAEEESTVTEPSEQPTGGQQEAPSGSGGLIIGIIAIVAVIAAAAVIIILAGKKKKAQQ